MTDVEAGQAGDRRSTRYDALIGLVAQSVMAGSTLVMLPFIVRQLSPDQVGVWYVFLSIQAMVFLLDFGASYTFTRLFGYVFAGAATLEDERVPVRRADGAVDPMLLASLLSAAQHTYLMLAVVAGGLLMTAGSVGIHLLTRDAALTESVWPAWAVFVTALLVQTAYLWQASPLIGSGRSRRNYEILVLSRVVQVAFSVIALWLAPSLLMLSIGAALSVVVLRGCYGWSLAPIRNMAATAAPNVVERRRLLGVALRSARQLAGPVIGVQLTGRFVAIAVAWYAGLAVSAQFSIAYQALVALNAIAFVVETILTPMAAKARLAGDQERLRSIYCMSVGAGGLIFLAGGLMLVTVVPQLLAWIGSKTALPPHAVVWVMVFLFVLEMNLFMSTHMVTLLTNTVPYWRAMVVSGVLIVVVTVVVGEAGGGLMAFLIGQFAVMAAYNYWRWPAVCVDLLGLRLRDIPGTFLRGLGTLRSGRAAGR